MPTMVAKPDKWGGYTGQEPPDYITIKNGLDIFYILYDTLLLACEAMSDVYTKVDQEGE